MRIIAKRTSHSLWKTGDTTEIKEERVVFCCLEMKDAWDGFIGFGEIDTGLNKNEDVNIYKCFAYPEGACWDEMAISYCPFCGVEITVMIEDEK